MLVERRPNPGRPVSTREGMPTRLSEVGRLSTASTMPPSSPGAAFTPNKK